MCKFISLISGKGGSGKTTLSLSMASLLSSCGIKVLLIDCDFSTNGATYFYEAKLQSGNEPYTSFYDILFCHEISDFRFIPINDFFDFLPSVVHIDEEYIIYPTLRRPSIPEAIYLYFRNRYDVVLFDCQAGYTDLLRNILPYTDVNLVVMEADSISSSALRSLYLKIGTILQTKKLYQVFNKVSSDEYDIYAKVSGGTFFTNIESIRFDWTVRKAFSISKVPDLVNTSFSYGKQILNVCKTLLPEDHWQEKLTFFESNQYMSLSHKEEETLLHDIYHLEKKIESQKNNGNTNFFFGLLIALGISFFTDIYLIWDTVSVHSFVETLSKILTSEFFPYSLVACSITAATLAIISSSRNRNKDVASIRSELKIKQQQLMQLRYDRAVVANTTKKNDNNQPPHNTTE